MRLCLIRFCLNVINCGVLLILKFFVNIIIFNIVIYNVKVNFLCRLMIELFVVNGERFVGWLVFCVVNIFFW